jgi:predicted TIM-barrel fold metal-dependent hydrolase
MVPRIFGPYDAIRRDYLIDEYLSDIKDNGVVASVYVQTNWHPSRCVEEVAWVQQIADGNGFPHAITGFADLAEPDLATTLDTMQRFPRLKGIRQQLHWHANPSYRFASRPDVMLEEEWQHGLAQLTPRGLLFELQVFSGQMPANAALARALPETTFVLQHAGMPEDSSSAGRAAWRAPACAASPTARISLSSFRRSAPLSGVLRLPILRQLSAIR